MPVTPFELEVDKMYRGMTYSLWQQSPDTSLSYPPEIYLDEI